MNQENPGYIVVEGPIGVGKTSLARRLAQSFGSELLLEEVDENPFLERFYKDPKATALPTQLFFLFQRTQQLQALRQGDMFRPLIVSDFLMEKDRLFARLTLDDDELRLYEQVYQHLAVAAPPPDLVIYLQAPVPVLLERIQQRSRPYEQQISADYLERLAESYTRLFHQYSATPLLIVNAAEFNPVDNEMDYNALLEEVLATRSGRRYFNPLPFELIK
ncbi:MAG: deoxynucleoside kinase [Pseudomonadota bacterium]|nr:deoxynucleoside kinase [Pseudomonadota bacterium]